MTVFNLYYTLTTIISDDVDNFLFGATVVIRKSVPHPFFLILVFGKHWHTYLFFSLFPFFPTSSSSKSKCQYLKYSCSSFIFIFTNTNVLASASSLYYHRPDNDVGL